MHRDSVLTGGREATLLRAVQVGYWKSMAADVRKFVQECLTFQTATDPAGERRLTTVRQRRRESREVQVCTARRVMRRGRVKYLVRWQGWGLEGLWESARESPALSKTVFDGQRPVDARVEDEEK